MVRATPLCFTLLLASCTIVNTPPTDNPGPLALVPEDCDPRPDARGVVLWPSLVLAFDGYPDPASVASFGPLSLRSGSNSFDYEAHVDLVAKAVILRPRAALSPGTQYTVRITPAVRSLDGRSPQADLFLRFTTSPTGPLMGDRHAPEPRTLATDVQPLFDRSCALLGCHGPTSREGALDLSAASSAAALLARSSQVSLTRVVPGDPSSSYLLRKLLDTPGIIGEQMPLGSPWNEEEIRTVSDWIATGAK